MLMLDGPNPRAVIERVRALAQSQGQQTCEVDDSTPVDGFDEVVPIRNRPVLAAEHGADRLEPCLLTTGVGALVGKPSLGPGLHRPGATPESRAEAPDLPPCGTSTSDA